MQAQTAIDEPPAPHSNPPFRPLAAAGVLLGAAGFAASLTCVYRGMRSVMIEAGGFCAQGGPYEIANECSNAQAMLLTIGILAMLVFGGLLMGATSRMGNSAMGAGFLMWGALFLVLGWNFLQLGFDPPENMGSAWGWIVSGIVFILMALGGLIPAAQMVREWFKRDGEPEELFKGAVVKANVPGPGYVAAQPASPGPTSPTLAPAQPAAPIPKRLNIPKPKDAPDLGPEPHERDWGDSPPPPTPPARPGGDRV